MGFRLAPSSMILDDLELLFPLAIIVIGNEIFLTTEI